MANDRKLFIKVYKILINTVLVYNVKILTMQVAIIKIGKIFWVKVAISVKTQVSCSRLINMPFIFCQHYENDKSILCELSVYLYVIKYKYDILWD